MATSIVALAGLALTSCDSSRVTRPFSAGKPLALAFSTPEQRETISFEMADPCTGEPIQATLETRQVTDFSDQTPHETIHWKYRFTGDGFTIVGHDLLGNPIKQLTGTSYNGSGEFNQEQNANLNTEKFEFTTTNDVRIFAKNYLSEAMDDFVMHANTHVTFFLFPPPPHTTSQVDNITTDCR